MLVGDGMVAADLEADGVVGVDGGDLLDLLRHMTISRRDIPKVSPPGDLDSGLAH
jgi:hypothetical protein